MPDFFDLIQCPDCGTYCAPGSYLDHIQSHDRTNREPVPVEFYDVGDGHVIAVAETKRGVIVDIEV